MRILFLTGPHAVGKSYFMQQLAENNHFFQFDTGPEMRKMHKASLSNKSIGKWVDIWNQSMDHLLHVICCVRY